MSFVVLNRGEGRGSNSPDKEATPCQQGIPGCSATVARSSDRHLTVGPAVTALRPASRIGPERIMSAPLAPAARRARPESRRRTFPAPWLGTAVACPSGAVPGDPATVQ